MNMNILTILLKVTTDNAMNSVVILFFLILVLCIVSIEARGIWGSKRRREEAERASGEETQEAEVDVGGFEATRRRFEVSIQTLCLL